MPGRSLSRSRCGGDCTWYPGKVLLVEKPDGEIVVSKAGRAALEQAQAAFAGAADDFGAADPEDVQAIVDQLRGPVR